jgi:cation diffusion facilitator family transporter
MSNQNRARRALTISFLISFLSLCAKLVAYYLTDSTTAMSDAAEPVVHVFAVGSVLYGFFLSMKPADEDHLYGHEKIEFLSVGVEGTVIILASFSILYLAVQNLIFGFDLQNLDTGMYLVGVAAVINLGLGLYLQKVGKEEENVIVKSNGKHVLTDVWTSAGVIITLLLIQWIVDLSRYHCEYLHCTLYFLRRIQAHQIFRKRNYGYERSGRSRCPPQRFKR